MVTRGRSDDANGFVLTGDWVWLRVSRLGFAYAFHASLDGAYWQLVRYFELGPIPVQVGFEVQSPCGEGCQARFSEVSWLDGGLKALRDGS